MRVIAGEFRSRRLQAPAGTATRPTSDRLRETLFNVLGNMVDGARVLDLYAGSGAVGIEALSRGAALCCFAERAPAALTAIRLNLAQLGLTARARVEPHAVLAVLHRLRGAAEPFDLVFLDPPYDALTEYSSVLELLGEEAQAMLRPGALVVAEHASRGELPAQFGALQRTRLLRQGDAVLGFFAVEHLGSSKARPE